MKLFLRAGNAASCTRYDPEQEKTLDKVQRHKELCDGLNALYAKKNHDYGDSFHRTFVEEGMAMARIRLGDKFYRFKTLSRGGERKVNDESIRDTLLDLANYAIMTVLEMEIAERCSSSSLED